MKSKEISSEVKILHRGPDFLIINKPPGLDCQNSRDDRPSLVQWMQDHYGFAGLVHRLDFGTSGVMICATNAAAAKRLTKQLQDGNINRKYLAIALGTGLPTEGTFKTPIDEASAVTHFKTIQTFANATLLELDLETGRKHQIRRHLYDAGFPLIGDHLYKKRGSDRLLSRPALHSWKLMLDGKTYEAPLASDIQVLLDRLDRIH